MDTPKPEVVVNPTPRNSAIQVGKSVVQLVNGDSIALMEKMPAGSIDCYMTSPPYNLGVKYEVYDDKIPRADYLDWTKRWLKAAKRAASARASLFLNMGCKPTDPLGPEQVLLEAIDAGWVLQNKLYWVKSLTVRVKTKPDLVKEALEKAGITDTRQIRAVLRAFEEIEGEDGLERTFGHFKSLNTPRFVNDCAEMVYHLTLDGDQPVDKLSVGTAYEDKSNLTRGNRGKNGDLRCRGNVIWIPYVTIQSRDEERPHPATFPIELATYCYKLHGLDRIKLSMDPFSGIGHSAMGAALLGLNHLGIEIGPKTHNDAVRMVREFVAEHVKAAPAA